MNTPRVIKPSRVHNTFYYLVGGFLLCVNKVRHAVQGYTRPRPFSIHDFQRAIRYDRMVVDLWTRHLNDYLGAEVDLNGKTVLELGPGADLGVGILLLQKGIKKYNAIDVNNLVQSVPDQFYEELFSHIEHALPNRAVNVDFLRLQLRQALSGKGDRINYVHRRDFDTAIFNNEGIDLIFSQAAFEHFDDVRATVTQLSRVVKSGAVLIAFVDLQTHTRWIREADPLNIYRFSDWAYNTLKFLGSPNRLRPYQYKKILTENGWINIQIQPTAILDKEYFARVSPTLYKRFRNSEQQMDCLGVMIKATKL